MCVCVCVCVSVRDQTREPQSHLEHGELEYERNGFKPTWIAIPSLIASSKKHFFKNVPSSLGSKSGFITTHQICVICIIEIEAKDDTVPYLDVGFQGFALLQVQICNPVTRFDTT